MTDNSKALVPAANSLAKRLNALVMSRTARSYMVEVSRWCDLLWYWQQPQDRIAKLGRRQLLALTQKATEKAAAMSI